MKVKKRKLKKRELKEDEFTKFVKNFVALWSKKQKIFIWGIIGVLVLAVGLVSFFSNKGKNEKLAQQNFTVAMLVFDSGRLKEAADQFKMIQQQFYGTIASDKSLYFLATCYFLAGDIKNAEENFEKYTKTGKDRLFLPSAYEGVAQCAEESGNYDKAIKFYKEAADLFTEPAFKVEVLFNLGRMYENKGNLSEAMNSYQQILKIAKTPGIINEAKDRIKLLRGAQEVIGG